MPTALTPGAGGAGSTWERIVRHKAPVMEPRESSAFGAAIEEFRARLDDPATQGAVFFAVCRGKVISWTISLSSFVAEW